jgi:hypothetical protein
MLSGLGHAFHVYSYCAGTVVNHAANPPLSAYVANRFTDCRSRDILCYVWQGLKPLAVPAQVDCVCPDFSSWHVCYSANGLESANCAMLSLELGNFDIADSLWRMLTRNLVGSCEHFQQPCGVRIGSSASR